jgi:Zn-dependent protease
MFNFNDFDPYDFLVSMVALVMCITIHEFAHAYAADRAGDDTPRAQGRISLNPIDHLDPMGTIMMVISSLSHFGIGWGKPVQINSYNFRHPRWDNLRVSLWGPLSNILFAAVVGCVLRFWWMSFTHLVLNFLVMLTFINIGLAVFNLIPVAPLDGSHILSAMLPLDMAKRYDYFMARHGMLVFIGLILFGSQIFPVLLGPPREFLWSLVTWPKGHMILMKLFYGL